MASILHFTKNEAPLCDSAFVCVLAHMPARSRQALKSFNNLLNCDFENSTLDRLIMSIEPSRRFE